MSVNETTGIDRRDFMCAGTAATAATAIGGSVAAAAAAPGQSPADPLAGLRNLRLLDLSVAIEHEAPGELDKPSIKYSDHEQCVARDRDARRRRSSSRRGPLRNSTGAHETAVSFLNALEGE